MGEAQSDADFIGLWLHYLEYCLLRCVGLSPEYNERSVPESSRKAWNFHRGYVFL